jgi:type I site-specific restriction endonuclease
MNEAETRAEYIDPALKAAGWGIVEGSRIRREYTISPGRIEGQGRRGKPLTADYVLEYRNTKLAVVEAKAWDEALTEGVAQAKNYAGKMAIRYTYSTNGQSIYGIDMQTGKEEPDSTRDREHGPSSARRRFRGQEREEPHDARRQQDVPQECSDRGPKDLPAKTTFGEEPQRT